MANTLRMNNELKYAQGMVERRQESIRKIGLESSRSEVLGTYRSLSACLREVTKHHNNIVALLDDSTAGLAIETSALVDNSRMWLAQSELACRAWGVTDSELAEVRRGVGV